MKDKVVDILCGKVPFFFIKTKEDLLTKVSENKLFLIKYIDKQWLSYEYVKKMILVNPYCMEYLPDEYKKDESLINWSLQSFEIQALSNARNAKGKKDDGCLKEFVIKNVKKQKELSFLLRLKNKIIRLGALDDVGWFDKKASAISSEFFSGVKNVVNSVLEGTTKNLLTYSTEVPGHGMDTGVGSLVESTVAGGNVSEKFSNICVNRFRDESFYGSLQERLAVRVLQLSWVKKVYSTKWPEHLTSEKFLMLDFALIDGKTLIQVSDELKDDEQIVLNACQSIAKNQLELTVEEQGLLNKDRKNEKRQSGIDKDLEVKFDGISVFSFASEKLKCKRALVEKVVWLNSKNIEGAWDYWKDDAQMMLYLLSINRNYVTCISNRLLRNKDFLMSCLNLDVKIFALLFPYILKHAVGSKNEGALEQLTLSWGFNENQSLTKLKGEQLLDIKSVSTIDGLTLGDVKEIIITALERQSYFLCFIPEPLDVDLDILLAASASGDPLIGASQSALTLLTMAKRRLKMENNYECLSYLRQERTSRLELELLKSVVSKSKETLSEKEGESNKVPSDKLSKNEAKVKRL